MISVFRLHIATPILVLGIVDILILYLSIAAGYSISYLDLSLGINTFWSGLGNGTLYVSAIVLSLIMMGLYQRQFIADTKITFLRLFASFASAVFLMSIVFYIFPQTRIWMSALLPAIVFSLIGVLCARIVFLRVSGTNVFKHRVLVFGAGKQAQEVEALEARGAFRCIGFLPVDGADISVDHGRVLRYDTSLTDFVKAQDVDEVVVALQERRGRVPSEDLLACRMEGVRISDFWTFMERQKGEVELDALNPSWMIFAEGFSSRLGTQRIVKRVFDIVASVLLLLFSLPVTLAAAAAVYLQDRGPVFYRQERVGLYGESFFLFKFRSMRVDAEKDGVARWAAANDSRVTPVGAFIRMARIDEIPQIINVLRGEMSFIGPRPERPIIVSELIEAIPYYGYRDTVKPGITGWAQVNYPYGASVEDAKQKLKLDLYYIKNYSLMLDCLILLLTVRVVLWPQGVR